MGRVDLPGDGGGRPAGHARRGDGHRRRIGAALQLTALGVEITRWDAQAESGWSAAMARYGLTPLARIHTAVVIGAVKRTFPSASSTFGAAPSE